ncbi:DEAD/DEAH box helicase [Myroides profundi]|uniref:DEAD-box ATP-dependent RNA helicase RhpA n=1 Tax=Myroides profundi TaxID=480520 RepID=A0AAJ5BFD5_MYRPR|nr:DEAD/DEAH box helicase [Myroides profundi]AJH15383.1 ATP-dependent RNA helicase RhlE [Myroides profundi]SER56975.1 ATP-dependent RNA helicase RhlE [Myroides profundi]
MNFKDLALTQEIQTALTKIGYSTATEIQQKAIPPILEGTDVIGTAQTGTGKTAAFAIPILQKLHSTPKSTKGIRALILVPTRELAIQVKDSFLDYSTELPLKTVTLFGGVPLPPQVRALKQHPEIIVATPGRLLDLINQKIVKLSNLEILVLDEADQMLDMGFIHDLKKILKFVPTKRQSLFFSATMPKEIEQFARTIVYKPVKIEVAAQVITATTIEQQVYYTEKKDKKALLHTILKENTESTLVFTRTKYEANNLVKYLQKVNMVAMAIHGNKSQSARVKALDDFKNKKINILIATDIAARGIDISKLPFVINYDIPDKPETYVHRIGRTGRAGVQGVAMCFCTPEQRKELKDIQRFTGIKMQVKQEI